MLRSFAGIALVATVASAADHWTASNGNVEISVDRTTGRVEKLIDKAAGIDYCNQSLRSATQDTDGNTGVVFTIGQRYAGLRLIDELRHREFSDLTYPGAVSAVHADAAGLTFEKRYPGAEFVVIESFRLLGDHLRWDVRIHKTAGPDRTVRVIYFAALPLGSYSGWAPISDAPFAVKPWLPFSIDYGQSTSGAIGEGRWRTCIPTMVFYSNANRRAISFTSPFEVPAVRIRFLTNTGADADFHWNSRSYPVEERPYFLVSNEYLGVRSSRDLETGLLIAAHPADWRPALGWVYEKYREYFDADPAFDRWDGGYAINGPGRDGTTEEALRSAFAGRHERGVRWEELHGHFPWYGLMIPPSDVKSWTFREHPQGEITRDAVRRHTRIAKEQGLGTFIYYNVTESVHDYASQNFPDSVARDESGAPIGAWKISAYPDVNACWLMNADPSGSFGKHMVAQAREMVDAYPDAAGFFWDVYGRSYMFDFAHDDGITMVNNKPAYYPEFMYQRLMRQSIRPLLRSRGLLITANKPVTIASCQGLDGIMAMEDAPREDSPAWITAQSYLGLSRHTMILEGKADNAEMMYLHCLRYGMFDTDTTARELQKLYRPYIDRLRGRKWVFYPQALQLPPNTEGNIFRLRDGGVMVTVVSAWRNLRGAEGLSSNLDVICRLPDAASMRSAEVHAIDLGEQARVEPRREGDTLRITLPRHGKASVIFLRPAGS
ncbi:MAG: hypothetical protein U0Q18_20470 [Bryobacteraceae bacterium]